MGFLRPDEFILLMDHPTTDGRMMTIDELKRLRDAGIQTAVWIDTTWDQFCRDDLKTFRWSYFDRYLERIYGAGLKCLISLWQKQASYYPYDFYIKTIHGYQRGAFSPWNAQAQQRSNQMLRIVRDQLSNDSCQIISGQLNSGERVLLNEPAYYDEYALADWQKTHEGHPDYRTEEGSQWLKESYLRLMIEQRKILIETPHREIWYMLSRRKVQNEKISCHGCDYIDAFLDAFKTLNPTSINHISFNYFPYGPSYWQIMARDRQQWNVQEFAGAEYCEGLQAGNGKEAIAQGLRGMLVGPLHPATHHLKLEDWMIDSIKETHQAFMERECQASH